MSDDRSELFAPAGSHIFPRSVQTAFVFAARYTHHRQTGGTQAVTSALAYVWPNLDERTRDQILRESHEATCNIDDWVNFRGDDANVSGETGGKQ